MLWNELQTDKDEGMICGLVTIKGHKGDPVNAYYARPAGSGPYPGMVLIHHMPGWDEFYREMTRRFAQHGYASISPDLNGRLGSGSPDDMAAKARAAGGVPDDQVVGDMVGAREYLKAQSNSNGKVGIIGTCSGGRQTFLVACRAPGFDAAAELWGGRVVAGPQDLTPAQPVAAIDYTKDLSCPLLGLFGNDDQAPSPEQVNQHEAELKKNGKKYEFHRYDGAGHGFFYYDRPNYRQAQAMDGWQKVFTFFGEHLS